MNTEIIFATIMILTFITIYFVGKSKGYNKAKNEQRKLLNFLYKNKEIDEETFKAIHVIEDLKLYED